MAGHPDHRRYPELELMAVRVARNPRGREPDSDIGTRQGLQPEPLVRDRAVALCPLQGVAERRRRGEHEIDQSSFPQLEALGEVEAEHVVRKGVRRKVEQHDLAFDRQADARVIDGVGRQADPVQERQGIDVRVAAARDGEAGDPAVGGREHERRRLSHSRVRCRPNSVETKISKSLAEDSKTAARVPAIKPPCPDVGACHASSPGPPPAWKAALERRPPGGGIRPARHHRSSTAERRRGMLMTSRNDDTEADTPDGPPDSPMRLLILAYTRLFLLPERPDGCKLTVIADFGRTTCG